MRKIIAILNVVAWAGFWAFGYLALSADLANTGQIMTAAILACVGAGVGIVAYLWLARHAESTGYARGHIRAVPEHLRDNGGDA